MQDVDRDAYQWVKHRYRGVSLCPVPLVMQVSKLIRWMDAIQPLNMAVKQIGQAREQAIDCQREERQSEGLEFG